jgi:hypothetical protein
LIIHVTDDCGILHDVGITVAVQRLPALTLSVNTDAAPTNMGLTRTVSVIADAPPTIAAGGITFSVDNEPTALAFERMTSPINATATPGMNQVAIAIQPGPAPTSDTVATLFYATLAGSTFSPAVTLSGVATTSTCATVSGSGAAVIQLTPPGCELGTLRVQPFTTGLYSLFPNPVTKGTEGTQVTYGTVEEGVVSIRLCDAFGRVVLTPVDGQRGPGRYSTILALGSLPNGVYSLSMRSGRYRESREVLIMK